MCAYGGGGKGESKGLRVFGLIKDVVGFFMPSREMQQQRCPGFVSRAAISLAARRLKLAAAVFLERATRMVIWSPLELMKTTVYIQEVE